MCPQILKFDLDGTPLSSKVLWSTDVSGLPLAGVLIMLVVDTILYGLLAAWLDNIIPTEYGTRRQPWFFLLPSYWVPNPQSQVVGEESILFYLICSETTVYLTCLGREC